MLGESFDVTLTKIVTNLGISSPVDIDAKVEASGNGVSIEPTPVFPGVDEKTGMKIAVKRIDNSYAEEVNNEISALKKVEHENIVRILDHFEEGSYMWIVMKFIDGKDLEEFVQKVKPSMSVRVKIMQQCVAGIHYMHSLKPRPMVHLDLKPANILVAGSIGTLTVKLVDFGIAKTLEKNLTAHTVNPFGTEAYNPPEYFDSSSGSISYRGEAVDVYALGMVFLDLVLHKEGREFGLFLGWYILLL